MPVLASSSSHHPSVGQTQKNVLLVPDSRTKKSAPFRLFTHASRVLRKRVVFTATCDDAIPLITCANPEGRIHLSSSRVPESTGGHLQSTHQNILA